MATRNIVPRADNEGTIGTTAKQWSEVRAVNYYGTGSNLYGIIQTDWTGSTSVTTTGTIIETFTAGENLISGNICYLKSDGKFWKAKANAESTTKGLLAMSNATIPSESIGNFIMTGRYATASLSIGSTYYISSASAGAITTVTGSTAGDQVRIIGYALSTSSLYIKTSEIYIEIS